jgi:uncharacterized membrane-anchored protein YjiN (DUF445 family)
MSNGLFSIDGVNNMKWFATGLLGLMTLVFCVCVFLEWSYPGAGYVKAFAEAAMVGALADWFAVTALFRHPLGLPIPHTAVIPRNKDRMGDGLATFVVSNFLTQDNLNRELRKVDFAAKVIEFLSDHDVRSRWVKELTGWIPSLLNGLDDQAVQTFIRDAFLDKARSINVSEGLARVLDLLTEGGRHRPIVNEILKGVNTLILENKEYLRSVVWERIPLPDWPGVKTVRKSLASWIADTLVRETSKVLEEASENPNHPIRFQFDAKIEQFKQDLRGSPEMQAKVEEFKGAILENAAIREYLNGLWGELKEFVLNDLGRPDSRMKHQLDLALVRLSESLQSNVAFQDKINSAVRSHATTLLFEERERIGSLIRVTFREWNPETVSQRIEESVGKDLQWIRVNGTVVGGAVGIGLHAASQLLR